MAIWNACAISWMCNVEHTCRVLVTLCSGASLCSLACIAQWFRSNCTCLIAIVRRRGDVPRLGAGMQAASYAASVSWMAGVGDS